MSMHQCIQDRQRLGSENFPAGYKDGKKRGYLKRLSRCSVQRITGDGKRANQTRVTQKIIKIKVSFRFKKKLDFDIVALLFISDNYCSTMD
jgi:hypothetical protein